MPKIDISLADGIPAVFTLSGCICMSPSGVAATEATIENGTLMPFFSLPCCTRLPPSKLTRTSDSAAPL